MTIHYEEVRQEKSRLSLSLLASKEEITRLEAVHTKERERERQRIVALEEELVEKETRRERENMEAENR